VSKVCTPFARVVSASVNSGKIAFYVMQIYNRINKGFIEEAKSSISNLKTIIGD